MIPSADPDLLLALDAIDDAVWSRDAQSGRLLYVNQAAARIFGHPIEAFYERPRLFHDVMHPEDSSNPDTQRAELVRVGRSEARVRILRSDGAVRHVLHRVRVAYDSSGHPVRFDGVVTDVTERWLAERMLEIEREALALLLGGREIGEMLGHVCRGIEECVAGAWSLVLVTGPLGRGLVCGGVGTLGAAKGAEIADLLGMEAGPGDSAMLPPRARS